LLILFSCAAGRELTCDYSSNSSSTLWPTFNKCTVSKVDLSETYKIEEHSFSGTSEQKSVVTVVRFYKPSQIKFLPKQMLNDFPRLNGIKIESCNTFTFVKDNLFTEDFGAIQYLDLGANEISTIEPNAFQHLPELKWINLGANLLRSLPHQIFKNNLELIVILLHYNQISTITPDFFENLNKLQFVGFGGNPCTRKDFGCASGSCSVSQEELDSGLSTCFNNFRNNIECVSGNDPKPEVDLPNFHKVILKNSGQSDTIPMHPKIIIIIFICMVFNKIV
jgi:Leucine-rich repeat (LRR) protein